MPPRIAQIAQHDGITFANLHLSHGQFLNRWQIMHVAAAIEGPAAIIGDFNAVGPTVLPGFLDVGPREPTHVARNVMLFRLDRCLVRGLHCTEAQALERGPSDHRPIILNLGVGTRPARAPAGLLHTSRRALDRLRSGGIAQALRSNAIAALTSKPA